MSCICASSVLSFEFGTNVAGFAIVLFGAFPMAYAALLPAFYLPFMLMLISLAFRGASIAFSAHAIPAILGRCTAPIMSRHFGFLESVRNALGRLVGSRS